MKLIEINKLGSGGFGIVHKCKCDAGNEYARKTLIAADPDSIGRFQREVRLISKLNHPNIVKVVYSQLSDAPYYFVMPLYSSSLLSELPNLKGKLAAIAPYFLRIIDGISYAHTQGVIHRDLKPENILTSGDALVITDFGLGRSLDPLASRATLTGDMFGTPGYACPEQMTNAKLTDARCDVFALGQLLYEMFTGLRPFPRVDLDLLPVGIRRIVDRSTKIDPASRFQTVEELKTAFKALLDYEATADEEKWISEIIQLITATGVFPTLEHAKNFIHTLASALTKVDRIQNIMMCLPPSAIKQAFDSNPDEFRNVNEAFCAHFSNSGWGYDYTDTIAGQCEVIYTAVNDPAVHAAIIRALTKLGHDHNRWHVMDVAAKLAFAPKSEDEGRIIAIELASLKTEERDVLKRRVLEGMKIDGEILQAIQ